MALVWLSTDTNALMLTEQLPRERERVDPKASGVTSNIRGSCGLEYQRDDQKGVEPKHRQFIE
jgi:hypothetical protein